MSTVYDLPKTAQRPPLAAQAAASIRGAVLDGHWRVGERVPSEPQLALELGISRATLREALRILVSDGVLSRRHGVGTFVERVPTPAIERGIDELFSLSGAIEQLGYTASVGDRKVEIVAATELLAVELRVEAATPVCHMRRVRMADGRPVILCDDYFPAALAEAAGLSPTEAVTEVVESGSLYRWFEERLGLAIDWALTRIEPVNADVEDAATLSVRLGTALLRLRQTHYTVDGTPCLYSENLHNSEVIRFHVQRRRPRAGLADA